MIDEKKLIENIHQYFCDRIEADVKDVIDVIDNHYLKLNKDICGIIRSQQKVGEWMPASEGLPKEEHKWYLTTHEDGSLIPHKYTKQHGFILNWEIFDLKKRERQGDVVAWLQLPEPYKGEEYDR